jgi:hypothetical protein
MLSPFVTWPGYDRLLVRLQRLRRVDYQPLFDVFLDVIVEDNRAGVLSGLDKDGRAMAPVTYRTGRARRTRFRSGQAMGTRIGRFKGRHKGGMNARFVTRLPNNNLTTAEYKRLAGPPLAPRGDHSRVIANLVKRTPRMEGGAWIVVCAWADVLDPKGRPLLPKHFEGRGRLKTRDLRGVRPQGMRRAVAYMRAFVKDLLSREG